MGSKIAREALNANPLWRCYELFHVNELAYNQLRRAVEFDPSNNPFRSDDCAKECDEEAGD